MDELLKSDLAKVALAAGLFLGGVGGGVWAAIKLKAAKELQKIGQQVMPPGTGQAPSKDERPSLHEKIEQIAIGIVTLTGKVGGIETRQERMERKVDKAVNDRAEIIDRLSHLEGRGGVERRTRPRRDTP